MVQAFFYTALFVTATTLPLVYLHTLLHGFSSLQASLALFCSINVMICWWEIGLFFNRDLIKAQYLAFKKQLGKHQLPSPMFMFTEVSLVEAMGLKYWAYVWSTYSLIDPRCEEFEKPSDRTEPRLMLAKHADNDTKLVCKHDGDLEINQPIPCIPCSYSDQTTWGFCVDVGNGFTTLVPSILFAACMTWPLLPARVVGVMGLIKFYQEM